MPDVSVDTEVVDVPEAKELAGGAVGVEGPEMFLIAWFIIGAFVILTSSIGLVGTLLLLPVVIGALAIGVVWYIWEAR